MRPTAEAIAGALGGRKSGAQWMAHCPAHDDRDPSLSITERDGRVLWHCYAGCDQHAVGQALHDRGLSNWRPRDARGPDPVLEHKRTVQATGNNSNHDHALTIWRRTVPTAGTRADLYLTSRCIRVRTDDVRYDRHAGTMVVPLRQRNGTISGVHRIFIAPDGRKTGRGKLSLGPASGGCVRLAPVAEVLWLAEGVENALSLVQMTGCACWATCGAGNMSKADLPGEIRSVVIAADNGQAGTKARDETRDRLSREGRQVRTVNPPAGIDWNDWLFDYEERLGLGDTECLRRWGLVT